jgi:hypothetical protein
MFPCGMTCNNMAHQHFLACPSLHAKYWRFGVHSYVPQFTCGRPIEDPKAPQWKIEVHISCTPFFLECWPKHSNNIGCFGVHTLVRQKDWSTSLGTAIYWLTKCQHTTVFGVPALRSQNIGVHVVNVWRALRLTLPKISWGLRWGFVTSGGFLCCTSCGYVYAQGSPKSSGWRLWLLISLPWNHRTGF